MLKMEQQLPIMLISWLSFAKGSHVLLLGETAIYGQYLSEQGCIVKSAELSKDLLGCKERFDFIFANYVLEKVDSPEEIFLVIKSLLRENGTLYLGMDNRLGLKYLCGEVDPYTGGVFDSIENYKYVSRKERQGRCYSRNEIEKILHKNGYISPKFYSVFPCLEAAQLIFSDGYKANEELSIRYTPLYRNPDSVLFREEMLFAELGKMGVLNQMANSYLIECTLDKHHTPVKGVSVSYDRGEQYACATIIRNDNLVVKKAVYPQGNEHIKQLSYNMNDLKEHNIPVVEGRLENNAYVMPYLSGKTGDVYLQELLLRNVDKFIEEVDHFRDMIMLSSEIIGENEHGIILKKGYFDMIPLNTIYHKNEFVFLDQEFYLENYPMNAILYRMVNVIYNNDPMREKILPKSFFWERYGMKEDADYLRQYGDVFMDKLRNRVLLQSYNDSHLRNNWIMERNKRKIMTTDFYEEHKRNCFKDLEGKQLILFGSGKFAERFLAFYKQDYPILRIVDNNQEKWGKQLQGITIESPESILPDRSKSKVIICIKDYENVFHQLKRMNVPHVGIYDAHYIYPGRQERSACPCESKVIKKYKVGYVSGVFDLFHIGHINLLRRAKEQCDYLIAAVTSDEYVRERKKREPFIPFEERLEVVRACRYVDEAVGVPFQYGGTIDAFKKYHFDCQFVGSDCAKDPWWLKQKEYLEQYGATLEFLSYTEQTSSTKIKALIEKKLL